MKMLKALYGAAVAALGATSTAYVAGNGHIGWQAGITIAGAGLSALGIVWAVPNKETPAA